MSREQARALAAEHPEWSQNQIADALGITQSAVWKALNPERSRELDRSSKRKRAARAKAATLERRRARNPVPGQLNVRQAGRTFVALVDPDVWEKYRHVAWHIVGRGYVAGSIGGKQMYLHRLVLNHHEPGWALVCDHINRDKLDNRRANLRVVTQRENCANRGGIFERAA
jgi:hypothetical protein